MIYSIVLLNSGIGNRDIPQDTIDIYDQLLQNDMGLSADDYEERTLYTYDMYEADKQQIVVYLQRESYDMVHDKVEQLISRYRFEGDLMHTIATLEKVMIFDADSSASTEEKVLFMSSLRDPEMYMALFMNLPVNEQAALIVRNDVKVLPAYDYQNVTMEEVNLTFKDELYPIIGTQSCYRFILTFKTTKIYVYMVKNYSLEIVHITNEANTLSTIYNGGY